MAKETGVSRLARITSIITMLKSKRVLTATSIAIKFDISIRTVYRDIRTLESAGIPVITIDGKGYALAEGYTLPPLMFTEAEANALVTAEHFINKTNDSSLSIHFHEALVKIKSIIRFGIKEKSDLLSERILITKRGSSYGKSSSLSELQLAITNLTLTRIIYQKSEEDLATTRYIEPLALYYSNENWILIAWCRLRHDLRTFRIDRIKKMELQNSTFKNRNFELKKYFASYYENIC